MRASYAVQSFVFDPENQRPVARQTEGEHAVSSPHWRLPDAPALVPQPQEATAAEQTSGAVPSADLGDQDRESAITVDGELNGRHGQQHSFRYL